MRAGLLSNEKVLDFLSENYVVTWVLPEELDEMIADNSMPQKSEVAKVLKEKFRPLVEMIILDPDGSYNTRLSMNDDIIAKFEDSIHPGPELVQFFSAFLKKGNVSRDGDF